MTTTTNATTKMVRIVPAGCEVPEAALDALRHALRRAGDAAVRIIRRTTLDGVPRPERPPVVDNIRISAALMQRLEVQGVVPHSGWAVGQIGDDLWWKPPGLDFADMILDLRANGCISAADALRLTREMVGIADEIEAADREDEAAVEAANAAAVAAANAANAPALAELDALSAPVLLAAIREEIRAANELLAAIRAEIVEAEAAADDDDDEEEDDDDAND